MENYVIKVATADMFSGLIKKGDALDVYEIPGMHVKAIAYKYSTGARYELWWHDLRNTRRL